MLIRDSFLRLARRRTSSERVELFSPSVLPDLQFARRYELSYARNCGNSVEVDAVQV